MSVTELLLQLHQLKSVDKLYIMQFLISELAQTHNDLLKPNLNYPVWSSYEATEAADVMLQVLKKEKNDHV